MTTGLGARRWGGILTVAMLVAACGSSATPVPTAAPATPAPATVAPATEAPATPAPATAAPVTPAPATETPATPAPSESAAPAGGDLVAQAASELAAAAQWPTTWTGPTTPTVPQKGKKVTVISCAQASACADEVAGVVEAGQAIGWNIQVVDGKGDPAVYNSAIRNAVTGGADGVILASINVGLVADALRFAKQHKVPVLNNASITDAAAGLDPTQQLVAGNNPDPNQYEGRIVGDWLIADSGGNANVVLFRSFDAGIITRDDAVVQRLKDCPNCKILDRIWAGFDMTTTPKMATAINSILDRFGDQVKYIMTPYSAADAFAVPALQARNRSDVKVVGFPGTGKQMEYCNKGTNMAAIMGTDLTWGGWAAVDMMNRIFENPTATPPDENNQWVMELGPLSQSLIGPTTATCPASGKFTELNKTDYRSEYKKLWGM
jgi:ribose transport system substrate-binding protein